jgi:galactose mutarotase-like enzyme
VGDHGLVAITNGVLTARINPLGAELWSLTDAQGREYMTDADPRWWAGHAPLLFPIVGALNGGKYRLDGTEYPMAKHGFARTSRFEQRKRRGESVRFVLTNDQETRAIYPFNFELIADFTLSGRMLSMGVTVRNAGEAAMPFSFGFHPAFSWPLPGGGAKEAHRIVFERDEPEPIRRIDPVSATLLPEPEPTAVVGNILAPEPRLFEKDALIWDRLSSRALTFAGEEAALDIAFADCPYLGIWQKPGAPFLAIEPWHGLNDPQGFDGELRAKPGIIDLAPGGERAFRMDVTVRPG